MNVLKVKANEIVVKKQDKVMEWYLIQEGSVERQFEFAKSVLPRNSIIGIMESEWFICDYVAKEDTTLIIIPCKNVIDLQMILREHENFRPIFLRTAVEQRHELLCMYVNLYRKTQLLHSVVESYYDDYLSLCKDLLITPDSFEKIEHFEAIKMQHVAENWEIASSNSLIRVYLRDYLQLMVKDDALCVGAILEASAQMRRVTLGIREMVQYLTYHKDMLYSDMGDDIFHLYLRLVTEMSARQLDVSPIKAKLEALIEEQNKLSMYSKAQMEECMQEYRHCEHQEEVQTRIDLSKEDCVFFILSYAGFEKQEIRDFKLTLEKYVKLPDPLSTDDVARRLRKEISNVFYQAYEKAFLKAMEERGKISPILTMFFNFGFMDAKLCGLNNAKILYNLSDSMGMFESQGVYSVFEWLKCIYFGKKETSKNEFDLDYNGQLQQLRIQKEITDEEYERRKNNTLEKVCFEIRNMFRSGHRITYGRVTTFIPILMEDDIVSSIEKMALTAERIEQAINAVRQVDYSILYRQVLFSDPEHGIQQEWIQKEVLPDVILMPGVGIKGMMWQETASVRSDTPARFIFPIFAAMDVDQEMLLNMGRYRWEICRKIQGVHWNDVRDRSLTSEYYDYMQFYRKNSELSADIKEKIKQALSKTRNNYREVFVKDYENWIKYESQRSLRLNKVSRKILMQYCPFSKEIRQNLLSNPVYENSFRKLDDDNAKKESRLRAVYDRYVAAGGELTPDLKENLLFYQM